MEELPALWLQWGDFERLLHGVSQASESLAAHLSLLQISASLLWSELIVSTC